MTQIKKILDKQGNDIFIRTSTKAVVDGNGYTVESRLQAMQDEINSAQLEIGAVESDIAPTEGSSHYVTSGGLYNSFYGIDSEINGAKIYSEYTSGKYISPSDGSIANDSEWAYTEYIPVVSGNTVKVIFGGSGKVGRACVSFYNSNKTWISGETSNGYTTSRTVTPSNSSIAYMRCGLHVAYLESSCAVYINDILVWNYTGRRDSEISLKGRTKDLYGVTSVAKFNDNYAITSGGVFDELNTYTNVNHLLTGWVSHGDSTKYYFTPASLDDNLNGILHFADAGNANTRTSLSVSNLKNGSIYRLRFNVVSTSTLPQSMGGLSTYNGTWTNLLDIYGNNPFGKGGNIDFLFEKKSSISYLVLASNGGYTFPVDLTISNFSIEEVSNFNKKADELDSKVTKIEGYAFMPSSYIPIKEGYETYMSITGSQGSALSGNFFFQGFSNHDKLGLYNLATKTKVQDISLPTLSNSRTHCNTMSFGGAKYDSSDDFPLLYICSGYTDTAFVSTSEVYVIRIVGTSGSYTSSLIQTITLDFGITNGWTEFVVDPIKNRAWINGSGIATYICVDLPSTSNSDVTIDNNTTIIDKFDRKPFTLGISTYSSAQGRFFYHNRIYWVSGAPDLSGEGEDALYIVVDNTLTHCTEAIVPLQNFGLSNGTSITYEPESCFIWNDDFYVAYRTFIAKIIQN